MTTNDHHHASGQVLVLFALFLVVLIGATAIAVDYGSWLKARRDYQNVADAAVLAGGGFLSRPVTNEKRTQARRAAWESLNNELGLGLSNAQLDGLDDSNTLAASPESIAGYRLWVSTPPVGATTKYPGAFSGASDRYLFAWVEKEHPSFFSAVFNQGERTVSAWATSGVFAGQFAVITLRQSGQGPNNAPEDIELSGTNTSLRVVDGDVGANWSMKLNASSNLYLMGDANVLLMDHVSCGNSCWSASQVSDGAGNLKEPQRLPGIIEDPGYPLPSVLAGVPIGPTTAVPKAIGTGVPPPPANNGSLTITKGTKSGVGCAAGGPRIGPGWYNNLTVNGCVVLDPTNNYADPNDANNDGDYLASPVPAAQQAGIFYITGQLRVGNGALVVGDGVTLVLRQTGNQPSLTASGSGAVNLNTGASDAVAGFPPNRVKAAYKTDGSYSYAFDATAGVWQYTASNVDKSSVGIAVYVVTPAQLGNNTAGASTAQIDIQAGSALAWKGVLYAPRDNIKLSGQPLHNAIGQFIAWTVRLDGGTTITQTYDGPGEAAPRLVEPRLGQ